MQSNTFISTNSKDLFVSIYVIGYDSEGESTIVLIHSKSPKPRLHFIAVIDSCKKGGHNLTLDMLKVIFNKYPEKNGILDLICWTHPDEDHSLGLDEVIKKYSNNKTIISLPTAVLYKQQNEISSVIVNLIKSLSHNKKKMSNRQNVIPFSERKLIVENKKIVLDGKQEINFQIESAGPYEKIAGAKFGDYKPNELSPLIIIKLDDMSILLGGDAPDMNIEESEQYLPSDISFVKTPHHCSESSIRLANFLKTNESSLISCTTKYGSVLPKKSVVELYCNISDLVGCTSQNIPNKSEYKFLNSCNSFGLTSLNSNDYGIICYEVSVVSDEVIIEKGIKIRPYSFDLLGSACELELK